MQKAYIQPAQRAPCKTGWTVLIPVSVARVGWLLACCHNNHSSNLTETQFILQFDPLITKGKHHCETTWFSRIGCKIILIQRAFQLCKLEVLRDSNNYNFSKFLLYMYLTFKNSIYIIASVFTSVMATTCIKICWCSQKLHFQLRSM